MTSRGSYQVANRDENKVAQQDQSYRSCTLTLLIFFMLCMILLIACLPWKNYSASTYHSVKEKNSAERHYDQENTKTIITTTKGSFEIMTDEKDVKDTHHPFQRYFVNTVAETTKNTFTIPSTTFESHTSADNPLKEFISQGGVDVMTSVKSINDDTSTLDIITNDNIEDDNIMTSIITPNFEMNKEKNGTTIHNISLFETYTPISSSTEDNFSKNSVDSFSEATITKSTSIQTIIKNDTYDITTEMNNFSETMFLNITDSSSINSFSTSATQIDYETYLSSKNSFTQNVSTLSYTSSESTINPINYSTDTVVSTISNTEKIYINHDKCNSSYCKQIASRMLSYMNHSADPCEDFYEYACGGMEADPQIIDKNLEDRTYQRIEKQMLKMNSDEATSLFTQYYDSCMQYTSVNMTERILLANTVINKIDQFYTINDWPFDVKNFTNLFADLLLNYSPILFDVIPDLDEKNPTSYTIRVGPASRSNFFDSETMEDSCTNQIETQERFLDFEKFYKNYKTCKNNTRKFIESIEEALTVLDVFGKLNNTYNISQHIQMTTINIDIEIVQKILLKFPSENEIREAYLLKNYTTVSLANLQNISSIINWSRLINLLTGNFVESNAMLQVYFYEKLKSALNTLEVFHKRRPMEFHNAVLGLYARTLYHDLVISKQRNIKQHCLRVAINLLGPEASSLYMSSFSDKEIVTMNKTIHKIFFELKDTLKLKSEMIQWAEEEQREILLKKIDDLQLSVPDISYFIHQIKQKVNLSSNYFQNSVILMQRYRNSIYSVIKLRLNPGTLSQIWTHYATPFQSKGIAIYGLNLVIIPYGTIDYGTMILENDQISIDYLTLATLGNLISQQISHHFDANGIYYWNRTRDENYSLFAENEFSSNNFENYINCQKDIYERSINMTLPRTSQTVSFKILQLTLNERISEIMGLRLVYDTLVRTRSPLEKQLPWFELDADQLFFLAYAQMYCTKLPLTASYISLYENEQLPSRISIFVTASNNKLLGEAWNCPLGSQINPSFTCNVFPYIEYKENEIHSQ